MEIIKFNKNELMHALQPILSVVERRNALPILLNVLIKLIKTNFVYNFRHRNPDYFNSFKEITTKWFGVNYFSKEV